MYLPAHFAETRPEVLHRFIHEHPLGSLVLSGPDGLDANHLPFVLVQQGDTPAVLHAHVARNNVLWQQASNGDSCLVIFQRPGAYISPNWYPSKAETHRQVPTWNYQVVHVHGRITIHDDEKFVRGVVGRLTRTHEARVNGEAAWKMADTPHDYMAQMLASIVGIEVSIERMVGKWKLGQNRELRDRTSAADALDARGERDTADAMRRA